MYAIRSYYDLLVLEGDAAGLLVCHDLPSAHLRFASMASCRSELPEVVAQASAARADGTVWHLAQFVQVKDGKIWRLTSYNFV